MVNAATVEVVTKPQFQQKAFKKKNSVFAAISDPKPSASSGKQHFCVCVCVCFYLTPCHVELNQRTK